MSEMSPRRGIMAAKPGLFKTDVEATAGAILRVADFLSEEREALRNLLELFGEFEAIDAIADLGELCDEDCPDLARITAALGVVCAAFEQLSFSLIGTVAWYGEGPRDLHAAIRWYGAKTEDLIKRFQT